LFPNNLPIIWNIIQFVGVYWLQIGNLIVHLLFFRIFWRLNINIFWLYRLKMARIARTPCCLYLRESLRNSPFYGDFFQFLTGRYLPCHIMRQSQFALLPDVPVIAHTIQKFLLFFATCVPLSDIITRFWLVQSCLYGHIVFLYLVDMSFSYGVINTVHLIFNCYASLKVRRLIYLHL